MSPSLSTLSGEQIRAARALVRVDQADLARRCGLSLETIKRLESIRGPVGANSRTLQALLGAFSDMGVGFERGDYGAEGVFLTSPNVQNAPAAGHRSWSGDASARPLDVRCHRLIYHSTATLSEPLHRLLDNVRVSATRRKADMDVTGMIYACSGRFLGVLEGPKANVRQVFGAISCDARHTAISVISDQSVSSRRFPDWTITCGQFTSDKSLLGNEPALKDGFRPEALSPASALGLASMMRDLSEEEPRKRLQSRVPCPLADVCLDQTCAQGAAA